MLDGDASGCKATERIAARLAGRCSLQLAAVPAGKQPDQLNLEEIRNLLDASIEDMR